MTRRLVAIAFCSWLAWLLASPSVARADVERFAVLVGNDRGRTDEVPLRYAESSAARLFDVLRELGGFAPSNVLLLQNQSAESLERTLSAVGERVRRTVTAPSTSAVLFVYYAGHADDDALHLGQTSFPIEQLEQLAHGSGSNVRRIVVLDACHSRAKAPAQSARAAQPIWPSAATAFLSALARDEDAHESSELQGPYFTHALLSGLLGAADRDADGAVALDEAFGYASRALHQDSERPSVRYDARGQGAVLLTQPDRYGRGRARVLFPPGLDFLVRRDGPAGAVVAEVDESRIPRALSLRPGRYYVRARTPTVLFQDTIEAVRGAAVRIDVDTMERIEYSRLVRTGKADVTVAHGLELGSSLRSALPNAETVCLGAVLGYGFDLRGFGARARVGLCGSQFDHRAVRASIRAQDFELRAYHAWDLAFFTVELGLGGGAVWFTQQFSGATEAPPRNSVTPYFALGARLGADLMRGFYVGADLAGETHFLPLQEDATTRTERIASFALRASLALGKHF